MIDFPGVIEVVSDHNADDVAGGQSISPIREALAIQLGIIAQSTNRIQPTLMSLLQPCQQFLPGPGAGTALRNERRLVAAHRGGTERIILIHPLGPTDMLEDIGDRAAACAWCSGPIFLAKIMEVGKQGMRRVPVERLFDEVGQSINGSAGD